MVLPAVVSLAAALSVPGVGRAPWAAPALTVAELRLETEPERVAAIDWAGRPGLMALGSVRDGASEDEPPTRDLWVLRVRDEFRVDRHWAVPEGLRWAEPLRLPDGTWGWLGLIGGVWQLGRPSEGRPGQEAIAWRPACSCDTVFAVGRSALRVDEPFAQDLDGDGRAEVLLPHWDGLVVYEVTADDALRPLWRDGWSLNERFASHDGRLEARVNFPHIALADVDGDGVRDLLTIRSDRLDWTAHPRKRLPAGEYFALDESARTDLSGRGLPPRLLAGLERLGDRGFAGVEALRAALREAELEPGPHLPVVLDATREAIPAYFPEKAELPQPPEVSGEARDVIAVEDMNGDGVPDVLLLGSTERGDLFNQKNQLRWYPGRLDHAKRLRYDTEPKVFFTEGFAFARLVRPSQAAATDLRLFLATMEVNVMAVVRAFVVRRVAFDVYLYPWRKGALVDPAPVVGELDFQVDLGDRDEKPMALVADLNGNGKRELLFNLRPGHLTAFGLGADGRDFQDGRLASVEVPLPRNPEHVLRVDLDGRPGEELLLTYRGKEHSAEERRTLRRVRLEEVAESQAKPPPAPGGQGR